MKVKMIIDSSADVTAEIRKQLNVVPITVRFGEQEYLDGVELDYDTFYKKLESDENFPSTSQANPAAFDQVYKETLEEYDAAVVLVISSKLSGTYQSAWIAAQEYEGKIFVVDSMTGSVGTGLLAQRGLELIQQGLDAQEIATQLNEEKEKVSVMGIPATLEYLKRGGRISSVSALAGSMLSIKPILGVQEGVIASLGKARGTKRAFHLLNERIESCGGVDANMPSLIAYSGMDDSLMNEYKEYSDSLWDNAGIARICSSVGTHLGPGAILVAFYKK